MTHRPHFLCCTVLYCTVLYCTVLYCAVLYCARSHDFPRFLELQPDQALFKNGLAWVLLAEGIPVIYYGTAAGMRGGTEGNRHRDCLWTRPYDVHSDLYRTIGTLSK